MKVSLIQMISVLVVRFDDRDDITGILTRLHQN
jgi:hypothetical protein